MVVLTTAAASAANFSAANAAFVQCRFDSSCSPSLSPSLLRGLVSLPSLKRRLSDALLAMNASMGLTPEGSPIVGSSGGASLAALAAEASAAQRALAAVTARVGPLRGAMLRVKSSIELAWVLSDIRQRLASLLRANAGGVGSVLLALGRQLSFMEQTLRAVGPIQQPRAITATLDPSVSDAAALAEGALGLAAASPNTTAALAAVFASTGALGAAVRTSALMSLAINATISVGRNSSGLLAALASEPAVLAAALNASASALAGVATSLRVAASVALAHAGVADSSHLVELCAAHTAGLSSAAGAWLGASGGSAGALAQLSEVSSALPGAARELRAILQGLPLLELSVPANSSRSLSALTKVASFGSIVPSVNISTSLDLVVNGSIALSQLAGSAAALDPAALTAALAGLAPLLSAAAGVDATLRSINASAAACSALSTSGSLTAPGSATDTLISLALATNASAEALRVAAAGLPVNSADLVAWLALLRSGLEAALHGAQLAKAVAPASSGPPGTSTSLVAALAGTGSALGSAAAALAAVRRLAPLVSAAPTGVTDFKEALRGALRSASATLPAELAIASAFADVVVTAHRAQSLRALLPSLALPADSALSNVTYLREPLAVVTRLAMATGALESFIAVGAGAGGALSLQTVFDTFGGQNGILRARALLSGDAMRALAGLQPLLAVFAEASSSAAPLQSALAAANVTLTDAAGLRAAIVDGPAPALTSSVAALKSVLATVSAWLLGSTSAGPSLDVTLLILSALPPAAEALRAAVGGLPSQLAVLTAASTALGGDVTSPAQLLGAAAPALEAFTPAVTGALGQLAEFLNTSLATPALFEVLSLRGADVPAIASALAVVTRALPDLSRLKVVLAGTSLARYDASRDLLSLVESLPSVVAPLAALAGFVSTAASLQFRAMPLQLAAVSGASVAGAVKLASRTADGIVSRVNLSNGASVLAARALDARFPRAWQIGAREAAGAVTDAAVSLARAADALAGASAACSVSDSSDCVASMGTVRATLPELWAAAQPALFVARGVVASLVGDAACLLPGAPASCNGSAALAADAATLSASLYPLVGDSLSTYSVGLVNGVLRHAASAAGAVGNLPHAPTPAGALTRATSARRGLGVLLQDQANLAGAWVAAAVAAETACNSGSTVQDSDAGAMADLSRTLESALSALGAVAAAAPLNLAAALSAAVRSVAEAAGAGAAAALIAPRAAAALSAASALTEAMRSLKSARDAAAAHHAGVDHAVFSVDDLASALAPGQVWSHERGVSVEELPAVFAAARVATPLRREAALASLTHAAAALRALDGLPVGSSAALASLAMLPSPENLAQSLALLAAAVSELPHAHAAALAGSSLNSTAAGRLAAGCRAGAPLLEGLGAAGVVARPLAELARSVASRVNGGLLAAPVTTDGLATVRELWGALRSSPLVSAALGADAHSLVEIDAAVQLLPRVASLVSELISAAAGLDAPLAPANATPPTALQDLVRSVCSASAGVVAAPTAAAEFARFDAPAAAASQLAALARLAAAVQLVLAAETSASTSLPVGSSLADGASAAGAVLAFMLPLIGATDTPLGFSRTDVALLQAVGSGSLPLTAFDTLAGTTAAVSLACLSTVRSAVSLTAVRGGSAQCPTPPSGDGAGLARHAAYAANASALAAVLALVRSELSSLNQTHQPALAAAAVAAAAASAAGNASGLGSLLAVTCSAVVQSSVERADAALAALRRVTPCLLGGIDPIDVPAAAAAAAALAGRLLEVTAVHPSASVATDATAILSHLGNTTYGTTRVGGAALRSAAAASAALASTLHGASWGDVAAATNLSLARTVRATLLGLAAAEAAVAGAAAGVRAVAAACASPASEFEASIVAPLRSALAPLGAAADLLASAGTESALAGLSQLLGALSDAATAAAALHGAPAALCAPESAAALASAAGAALALRAAATAVSTGGLPADMRAVAAAAVAPASSLATLTGSDLLDALAVGASSLHAAGIAGALRSSLFSGNGSALAGAIAALGNDAPGLLDTASAVLAASVDNSARVVARAHLAALRLATGGASWAPRAAGVSAARVDAWLDVLSDIAAGLPVLRTVGDRLLPARGQFTYADVAAGRALLDGQGLGDGVAQRAALSAVAGLLQQLGGGGEVPHLAQLPGDAFSLLSLLANLPTSFGELALPPARRGGTLPPSMFDSLLTPAADPALARVLGAAPTAWAALGAAASGAPLAPGALVGIDAVLATAASLNASLTDYADLKLAMEGFALAPAAPASFDAAITAVSVAGRTLSHTLPDGPLGLPRMAITASSARARLVALGAGALAAAPLVHTGALTAARTLVAGGPLWAAAADAGAALAAALPPPLEPLALPGGGSVDGGGVLPLVDAVRSLPEGAVAEAAAAAVIAALRAFDAAAPQLAALDDLAGALAALGGMTAPAVEAAQGVLPLSFLSDAGAAATVDALAADVLPAVAPLAGVLHAASATLREFGSSAWLGDTAARELAASMAAASASLLGLRSRAALALGDVLRADALLGHDADALRAVLSGALVGPGGLEPESLQVAASLGAATAALATSPSVAAAMGAWAANASSAAGVLADVLPRAAALGRFARAELPGVSFAVASGTWAGLVRLPRALGDAALAVAAAFTAANDMLDPAPLPVPGVSSTTSALVATAARALLIAQDGLGAVLVALGNPGAPAAGLAAGRALVTAVLNASALFRAGLVSGAAASAADVLAAAAPLLVDLAARLPSNASNSAVVARDVSGVEAALADAALMYWALRGANASMHASTLACALQQATALQDTAPDTAAQTSTYGNALFDALLDASSLGAAPTADVLSFRSPSGRARLVDRARSVGALAAASEHLLSWVLADLAARAAGDVSGPNATAVGLVTNASLALAGAAGELLYAPFAHVAVLGRAFGVGNSSGGGGGGGSAELNGTLALLGSLAESGVRGACAPPSAPQQGGAFAPNFSAPGSAAANLLAFARGVPPALTAPGSALRAPLALLDTVASRTSKSLVLADALAAATAPSGGVLAQQPPAPLAELVGLDVSTGALVSVLTRVLVFYRRADSATPDDASDVRARLQADFDATLAPFRRVSDATNSSVDAALSWLGTLVGGVDLVAQLAAAGGNGTSSLAGRMTDAQDAPAALAAVTTALATELAGLGVSAPELVRAPAPGVIGVAPAAAQAAWAASLALSRLRPGAYTGGVSAADAALHRLVNSSAATAATAAASASLARLQPLPLQQQLGDALMLALPAARVALLGANGTLGALAVDLAARDTDAGAGTSLPKAVRRALLAIAQVRTHVGAATEAVGPGLGALCAQVGALAPAGGVLPAALAALSMHTALSMFDADSGATLGLVGRSLAAAVALPAFAASVGSGLDGAPESLAALAALSTAARDAVAAGARLPGSVDASRMAATLDGLCGPLGVLPSLDAAAASLGDFVEALTAAAAAGGYARLVNASALAAVLNAAATRLTDVRDRLAPSPVSDAVVGLGDLLDAVPALARAAVLADVPGLQAPAWRNAVRMADE
jgi:hypothetical protein